jgi:S1-C subfamily serine protease
MRNFTLAGLFALTLVGAATGGGIVGASVATRSGALPVPVPAPAMASPALAQQFTATDNIAGQVFDRVNPSVVQIIVSGRSGGQVEAGAGSGFVVDPRGFILSNQHVVAGARTISVRFSTGATREAQVVGTDRGNDLALLRVDLPEGVPAAPLANSDAVRIGDTAFAIGSPFGLAESLTQGIVSAVDRTWAPGDGRVRRGLLQTDAPINPGNSGGPLLNARGEVIGVTSMIESPVRGNVGVGFAIPINTATRLLPRLEGGAQLEPVWLGIAGQALDAGIARDQGVAVSAGVLITNLVPNGPAAAAGLRAGDAIVAIDGTSVSTMEDLAAQLATRQPGESINVSLNRAGRQQDVRITLQAWPAQ